MMVSLFAIIASFDFCPKTMDYSKAFLIICVCALNIHVTHHWKNTVSAT